MANYDPDLDYVEGLNMHYEGDPVPYISNEYDPGNEGDVPNEEVSESLAPVEHGA
ncbi:hypothetical protein E1B28_005098 [Marasmius oreades]|uniref:Uncharacterized protein n=1 Tax=Marasmius oreades TaxID=181124 RepID=A0A9P7UZW6_9AGAR|nr:uncharacterized protein E1B28_005098 [Marasmius oreades]KAG7097779.1 hypothetical protein E1B28_005098 [Marasmius oreades]